MGGGTALVSLPKEWVRRNNVGRGTVLSVDDHSGDTLTIYPFSGEKAAAKEILIDYPPEYLENLINGITGGYLLGYDIIKIQGKRRMRFEDREKIKKSIRQLVGLEILEEDAKSITAQFLLESTILEPEKILRRMHMIVREMYKDALTALLEKDEHLGRVAAERDEEVNRLYFLLVRLIRSSVMDAKLAAKFHLTAINCLDYRVAANLLESVGDAAVEIAKSVVSIMNLDIDKEITTSFVDVSDSLERIQDLAVTSFTSFVSRSDEGARKLVDEHRELTKKLQQLEDMFLSRSSEMVRQVWGILSAFYKISESSIDIADLAFPMHPIIR